MFDSFTPVTGSLGGSMIGLASAILLLGNGDILGASGIMSSILTDPKKALADGGNLWKLGLLTTFLVTSALMPQFASDPKSIEDKDVPIPSSIAYVLAGLLVGYGTRMGNGCTSGHGICGLGRLSPRSAVAVMTFMATGAATAVVTSPKASWADATSFLRTADDAVAAPTIIPELGYAITAVFAIALLFVMPSMVKSNGGFQQEDKSKFLGGASAGVAFAAGLAISGMVLPSKLYTFLDVEGIADGTWDPTLMTVMGCGIPVSFLAYQLVPNFGVGLLGSKAVMSHPIETKAFHVPTNRKIDWNLIMGEAMFGMGWGLGLLCPGPALYHVGVGNVMVISRWMPAFVVGAILAQKVKAKQQ
ncbi:MAG: hypothetical protein SGARI_001087 [Bacillariaceae sp.]